MSTIPSVEETKHSYIFQNIISPKAGECLDSLLVRLHSTPPRQAAPTNQCEGSLTSLRPPDHFPDSRCFTLVLYAEQMCVSGWCTASYSLLATELFLLCILVMFSRYHKLYPLVPFVPNCTIRIQWESISCHYKSELHFG